MTKSIQSHANHSSGVQHVSHNQLHNQVNHGIVGNHDINTSANRVSGGVGYHAGSHQQKNQRNLSPSQQHQSNNQQLQHNQQEWRQPEETGKSGLEESFYETGPVVNDGKHSLLQYAMLNFRQSTEK